MRAERGADCRVSGVVLESVLLGLEGEEGASIRTYVGYSG